MMWLLQKIPLGFSITNVSISRLGGAFGLSYLKSYFDFSLLSLCKTRGDIINFFWGHCYSQKGSDNSYNITTHCIKVITDIQSHFAMIRSLRGRDSNSLCSHVPK